MARVYDATASFGRTKAGMGFNIGVLMCLAFCGYGAYLAFGNGAIPTSKPQVKGKPAPTRTTRYILGGVMASVGLCVLCVAWGQRKATRSSKMYSAGYAVSSFW